MAWTFPNNWVDGNIVSAANLNKIRYDMEHWGGPVDGGGYMLTNAILDNATKGGVQTPWLQNINGGGFALTGAGNIGVGTATVPINPGVAGRSYLTVKGASDMGILELATGSADSDGSLLGQIAWTDPVNNQTDKRLAGIYVYRSGVTASNRGSYMAFGTRSDGAALFVERMRITNAGDVGVGTSLAVMPDTGTGPHVVVGPSTAGTTFGELVLCSNRLTGTLGYLAFANYLSANASKWGAAIGGSAADADTGLLLFLTNNAGTLAERMRIDSIGRVGIGTASPGAKLSFGSNAVVDLLHLFDNGTNKYGLGIQPAEMRLYIDPVAAMTFGHMTYANAFTERMRIDNAGRVGIGTAGPLAPLTVLGNNGVWGTAAFIGSATRGVSIGDNGSGAMVQGATSPNSGVGGSLLLNPNGGPVGIGTVPNSIFHVRGTGSNGFILDNSDNNSTSTGSWFRVSMGASTGNTYVSLQQFISGGSAPGMLALNPLGGNVGIGTTNPTSRLAVETSGVTQALASFINNTAATNGNTTRLRLGPHSGFSVSPELSPYIEGIVDVAGTGSSGIAIGTFSGGGLAERLRLTGSGGIALPTLPSTNPGAGTKQLWYDPADGNRIKYAA